MTLFTTLLLPFTLPTPLPLSPLFSPANKPAPSLTTGRSDGAPLTIVLTAGIVVAFPFRTVLTSGRRVAAPLTTVSIVPIMFPASATPLPATALLADAIPLPAETATPGSGDRVLTAAAPVTAIGAPVIVARLFPTDVIPLAAETATPARVDTMFPPTAAAGLTRSNAPLLASTLDVKPLAADRAEATSDMTVLKRSPLSPCTLLRADTALAIILLSTVFPFPAALVTVAGRGDVLKAKREDVAAEGQSRALSTRDPSAQTIDAVDDATEATEAMVEDRLGRLTVKPTEIWS